MISSVFLSIVWVLLACSQNRSMLEPHCWGNNGSLDQDSGKMKITQHRFQRLQRLAVNWIRGIQKNTENSTVSSLNNTWHFWRKQLGGLRHDFQMGRKSQLSFWDKAIITHSIHFCPNHVKDKGSMCIWHVWGGTDDIWETKEPSSVITLPSRRLILERPG